MAYKINFSSEEPIIYCKLEGEHESFERDGMKLHGYFMFGKPVPHPFSKVIPIKMSIFAEKYPVLPDIGHGLTLGWVVSESFKEIIEELGQGVNEFFKIRESVDQNGNLLPKTFYLMNVVNRLNPIDMASSPVHWEKLESSAKDTQGNPILYKILMLDDFRNTSVVLKRSVISNHHLWRGPRGVFSSQFFVSDICHERIRKAKLTGIEFIYCKESD